MDLLSLTLSAAQRVCSICGNRTVDHHIDRVIKCTMIVIIAHFILFCGYFADYPPPKKLSPALRPQMSRVGRACTSMGDRTRGSRISDVFIMCSSEYLGKKQNKKTSAVV